MGASTKSYVRDFHEITRGPHDFFFPFFLFFSFKSQSNKFVRPAVLPRINDYKPREESIDWETSKDRSIFKADRLLLVGNVCRAMREKHLTFGVGEHFHATAEHRAQHSIVLLQGAYGGVMERAADVQFDILRRVFNYRLVLARHSETLAALANGDLAMPRRVTDATPRPRDADRGGGGDGGAGGGGVCAGAERIDPPRRKVERRESTDLRVCVETTWRRARASGMAWGRVDGSARSRPPTSGGRENRAGRRQVSISLHSHLVRHRNSERGELNGVLDALNVAADRPWCAKVSRIPRVTARS